VNAWGGLAIAGAVLTAAPALGHVFGLTAERAWQVAACGAAALVLFWVLFVLPSVDPTHPADHDRRGLPVLIAVWIAPGARTRSRPPRRGAHLVIRPVTGRRPCGSGPRRRWRRAVGADLVARLLSTGYTIYGDCSYTADTYCVSDVYFPGHYVPGGLAATRRCGCSSSSPPRPSSSPPFGAYPAHPPGGASGDRALGIAAALAAAPEPGPRCCAAWSRSS